MPKKPSVPTPTWADIVNTVKFEDDTVTKGSFTAIKDDEIVGLLRYEIYHANKVAKLRYIGVVTQCRSQGLGAALVQALHQAWPDYLVDPGQAPSVDGERLRQFLVKIPGVLDLAVPGAANS